MILSHQKSKLSKHKFRFLKKKNPVSLTSHGCLLNLTEVRMFGCTAITDRSHYTKLRRKKKRFLKQSSDKCNPTPLSCFTHRHSIFIKLSYISKLSITLISTTNQTIVIVQQMPQQSIANHTRTYIQQLCTTELVQTLNTFKNY